MDAALRKAVWERARSICEYCRMPQEFDRLVFEVDHVIPEKHGGLSVLDNLALACFFCNRYKGPNLSGFDPATGALTQLFDPRSQIWADHFFGQAANCREKLRMAEQQLPFFGSMISLG